MSRGVTLKIVRPVSRQVSTPRLSVRHGCLKFFQDRKNFAGRRKPVRTASNKMNILTHEGSGRFRASIENEIERLISLLDAMEPDPDLEEPGDLEPLLGWPNVGQVITAAMASDDDRELDDVDLEDGGDSEPSLAAPERHPASWESPGGRSGQTWYCYACSQNSWVIGSTRDGEDDAGENGEPDHDGEYSFGWQNEGSQVGLGVQDELEPYLGATEEIDQCRRGELISDQWLVEDGEDDQTGDDSGRLAFNGDGYREARNMLSNITAVAVAL